MSCAQKLKSIPDVVDASQPRLRGMFTYPEPFDRT